MPDSTTAPPTSASSPAGAPSGTAPVEPVAFPQDRTCPYHPPTGYDPLRTARPLTRVTLYDGRPVWMVTGHTAARALLADPRLSTDRTREGFPMTTPRFAAVRDRTTALLGVDDPQHRTQRRMLVPSFTLKRAVALRPDIQRIVDGLLDRMTDRGAPADLVPAFALPVPSMVICALLGVPYADHEFFEAQSRTLLRGPTAADTQAAREHLEAYLGDLIDRKQNGESGDGVLDELVRNQLRAGELDRKELIGLALILLVAGHETTANMISLGTFTLLQHPDRLAELRADPALWPAAVEELMRMLSIADGLLRVATEDIEVDGTVIRAGEGVLVSTSVVNRDETVYEDPDSLDFHRPARHHLAFGFGIHQCLGQNLARTELEIALSTLFRRLPALRLAAEPETIPFKPGDTIQGMLELPVTW
ncbi:MULTISPECIES: cytochrome P450 [Streptomyces]|mgnify:CR=1 FL=1|uniref:Cytochrome P450 n=1 Tax=Streptomyces thermoviolaceus subsp. thermoviolaceus TaxID=66860 RepID=A0ABX0YND4_STRTL|nr:MULTISPECIES: cytochrome P450 [Streptomyces]NJP13522.1 cytochrome P450 [Streptomyces thermoviolaceus subsp. thermoviolaceus]RSS05281.1 cytochrome P450 [Streptomyces sp. WAC00469]GGV66228.1 cytochrome P450 [Streptomyces thermoviolaceus subsp. apingens]GHA76224.1 cytochrome P450 [Streptomyces thermoviolaceus subsp. thermoviolaceus]